MKPFLPALRTAVAAFTILPVGAVRQLDTRALALLPAVGCGAGAIAGTLGRLLSMRAPSRLAPVAAAISYGSTLFLTGALHADGFLDAADALFATTSPERRGEIMRDPHVGSFAVAAFSVVVAVSCASLASLPARSLPSALGFAAGTARCASLANAFTTRYHGGGSAARAFSRALPPFELSIGVLVTLALGRRAFGTRAHTLMALAVFSASIGAGLAIGRSAARRLDNAMTGDVYGFIIVVIEPLVLAATAVAQI